MLQSFCHFLFNRVLGWTAEVTVPARDKCLLCVAPHTSNKDFLLGELYIRSIGRKAGFLMKKEWFFWPLGSFFRSIGGIPVVDDEMHLVGIVTNRDLRFENDLQKTHDKYIKRIDDLLAEKQKEIMTV